MKKFNVKTLVIFGVLLVVMVLVVLAVTQIRTFMSGATSDVEPQAVSAVPGDDGKSAVITWTSDKESISKIEYGTTAASLVLMAAETSAMTSHSVSLSSLRPATTYYYRIRIGDEVFDNGGIPYTFKTKADVAAVVTAVPTIVSVASSTSATVCDSKTDYNADGIVNSMDLTVCKKNGGMVAAVTPTVTVTAKKTSISVCGGNIADYNSDGVINSLDRVNCLQSQR